MPVRRSVREERAAGGVVARDQAHTDGDRCGERVPGVGSERLERDQVRRETGAGVAAGVEEVE